MLLNVSLLRHQDQLDENIWRFILTGGMALEDKFPPKPCDWLGDRQWQEMFRISNTITSFEGLYKDFTENVAEWYTI